jgi:hypothetical protein
MMVFVAAVLAGMAARSYVWFHHDSQSIHAQIP